MGRCCGSIDPLLALTARGCGSTDSLLSLDMPLTGDFDPYLGFAVFFADDITSEIGILFAGLRIGSSSAGRVKTGERNEAVKALS